MTNWTNILEANGAVFIPSAGYRNGNAVNNVNEQGFYWSSTNDGSGLAFAFGFGVGGFSEVESNRYQGRSVRLVHDH